MAKTFPDVSRRELGGEIEWPTLDRLEANLAATYMEEPRFQAVATEARYAHEALERIAEAALGVSIDGSDGFDLARLARVSLFFRRLSEAQAAR